MKCHIDRDIRAAAVEVGLLGLWLALLLALLLLLLLQHP
jgi:hypothetical protein